jgi:hypothetical protein
MVMMVVVVIMARRGVVGVRHGQMLPFRRCRRDIL